MNGWSDGGVTIATAVARRHRNPSGGSLREPWVSEDGRGEMEKKLMEKGGWMFVQGRLGVILSHVQHFVALLSCFHGLWSKVF